MQSGKDRILAVWPVDSQGKVRVLKYYHRKDFLSVSEESHPLFCPHFQGCELLQEDFRFTFLDSGLLLLFKNVSPKDAGFYTCRMTFVLGGVTSRVTETIECLITGENHFQCMLF